MKRHVFFISDSTGITAEVLGHSLLTQFDNVEFLPTTLPFIDTLEKAEAAITQINAVAEKYGEKGLVFATLINPKIKKLISQANCLYIDFFASFLNKLKRELQVEAANSPGRSHGLQQGNENYNQRIDAINFALSTDDGIGIQHYNEAEIILVGVSRCGKTPTCLYLALQYGILAANYPFTEEDIEETKLPEFLQKHRHKLFGLTIDPERLCAIRSQRRPNSRYAELVQCKMEVEEIEHLLTRESIPFLSTTTRSIEEISATILAQSNLKRRSF